MSPIDQFRKENPDIANYIRSSFPSSWKNCIIIVCIDIEGRERRLLYNYVVHDYIYITHCNNF